MTRIIPALIGAAILAAIVHSTLGAALAHFKDALPCIDETQHADGDCDHHDEQPTEEDR